MDRNKGRRFDDEPKLNIKKVIATIVALIVIIMVISSMLMVLKKKNASQQNLQDEKFFSAFNNSKWTVINSKGEELSSISYDEMILVPNNTKKVFIVSYDVDYTSGNFKTKAVNEKNEQLFSNYNNVNAIINTNANNEVWYDEEVLKFEKDNKYGLIDYSGKEVLAADYDKIEAIPSITRILTVEKDGKKGLYNTVSKSLFINPTYTEVEAFGNTYNEGFLVKDENNKYGLLGAEGKVIIEPTYDQIYKVTGGDRYVVKDGVKNKLITREGNIILESGFDEITEIVGDAIVIKNAGKYGVLAITGEVIIDAAFDSAKNCFEDYYIVSSAGKYGVINLNKDFSIELKYTNIAYRNDIASLICENEDHTTDIYNRELKYILTGTINKVDNENGYIRAKVGDDYKYYNLQYQEISNKEALKNNTLFLINENGKYGYENKDGKKVVDCIYDDAQEQNEYGFAAVNKDGKWGVLAENGNVLLEPSITLDNNIKIDFIGKWHLSENMELNTYVK